MPNGIADIGDVTTARRDPPTAVLRLTPPVAGRWGESQSVPGYPRSQPEPPAAARQLVPQLTTTRSAPATRRTSATYIPGTPRDAADDN